MENASTPLLSAVRVHIESKFDETIVAHDVGHLLRVENNALRLAQTEGGDLAIVRLAALLHDYHRFAEHEAGRHVSPEEAQYQVDAVLREFGADDDVVRRVGECIAFTEKYRCAGDAIDPLAYSIEARIVRDADMLDALGAVGIARAFMFGGRLGQPMWSDEKIGERFVHGKTHSVVHHFHEKLLHLADEMMTAEGQRLAAQRTAYMRDFLDRLMHEVAEPASAAVADR